MHFDLRFSFELLLRRLPYIVIIMGVCTAGGFLIAYTLPAVYRAEARLLVERPVIPDELAASTVRSSGEELLLAIQQRLTTRDNLMEVSERFGLHEDSPGLSPDRIVADMRRRIVIVQPPFQQGTGVVTVSFRAPDPDSSADVTNALVSQILAQNVELRTSATGGTLNFFRQEVDRLSGEIATQNARIMEFKNAHRDALPESLDYRRSRQAAEQERLLQVDRELASLRDRRNRLTELYDRTGRLAASVQELTPEQTRLEELRQELASAIVVYAPDNPRVRALRTQVEALERVVERQLGGDASSRGIGVFDLQMADIDGQIEFLAEQKAGIQRALAELEETIAATPANAVQLSSLESDQDNLRAQYNQAVASLAEATMGDRIEVTAQGQRISVIEPAAPPSAPAEPNRKLIAAAGIGAGVVLSAALMFLLELLNSKVRRPAELVSALGITPFGSVPYVETTGEVIRRRLGAVGMVLLVLLGLPLALYSIHVAVRPLDRMVVSAAERFGLEDSVARYFPSLMQ
ncbi:MAG: lipopolysaccharide biosynthesis protein [Rhodobacteraceae bacterium]|jgi:polysaccharide chain length determinant protein (PEP-CTERM system associated)|nr:lipopolysaccharide biosynthesis protein [Paracoccaceae bacterium]